MKRRCQCPTASDFDEYGGRGIRVCERWQVFDNFLADMGERPTGMTIDRIDVNGNYEISNCRWATPVAQATNRRPKRLVRFGGADWSIAQLATHLGLDHECLVSRLKRKWPEARLAEGAHFHRP
jgi:hypothetical protein